MLTSDFPAFPRLMNRFTIGADPEFGLLKGEPTGGHTMLSASGNFLLQTGAAWGSDGAGRPVEMRPYASRWCLEIVASLVEEMEKLDQHITKAMADRKDTFPVIWTSRPCIHGGCGPCGGHLHFGRKLTKPTFYDKNHGDWRCTPRMTEELHALDRAFDMMMALGLFDLKEVNQRRSGEYGHASGWRNQPYGYEYRTWPTWLASPELAFIALTLGKIAVVEPKAILALPTEGESLLTLAQSFGHQDSDCYLLHALLSRPKEEVLKFGQNFDIRGAWITTEPTLGDSNLESSPVVLQPRRKTLQALWDRFLKVPPKSFTIQPLLEMPEGFQWIKCPYVSVFEPFVCHKSFPIHIWPAGGESYEKILTEYIPFGALLGALLGGKKVNFSPQRPGLELSLSQYQLDKRCRLVLRLQAAGFFPMWLPGEATEDSLPKWRTKVNSLVGGNLCPL